MMKISANISVKLTVFMLAISVFPLFVFLLVSYRAVLQTTVENATRHHVQLLANQRDYLDRQTDQIDSLAENPAWAAELTRLQEASHASRAVQSSYDDLATKARIGQLLSGYTGLGGLDSIDLYTPKGVQYHIGEPYEELPGNGNQLSRLMTRALASPGQTVWYGIEDHVNLAPSNRKAIVSVKSIYRSGATGPQAEPAGMLRMRFSTEYLHDHFSTLDLGTGAYLLLVDAQHRLLFHPDRRLIGQPLVNELVELLHGPSGSISLRLNGEDVLLSYLQIPDKKWYLLSLVPQATLAAPMLSIERTGVAVLLVSLLLIALFIRIYVRQVVQPIRVVSDGFRDFQANRLTPDWRLPKPKAWVQIGELVTWFNAFLDTMQASRQSEENLRESEEKYRLLVENSHEIIYTLTKSGVFTFVSSAWTALLGHPVNQVVGQLFLPFVHREDVAVCTTFMQKVMATGQRQEGIEFRVQHLDGSWRWYHSNAVPLRDATGKILGLQGSGIDITARKQAEEALRIAATAFESQQGGIVTNAECIILRVNRAFTQITGFSAEEAIGRDPRMLSSGRHDGAFYTAMWASIKCDGCWQGEIWNRRKDGEIYPEWLAISAVADDSGRVTHYVGAFSDLTAHKSAEDRIKQLAFYDSLTGLPNRQLLLDRLEQAQAASARNHHRGALLFVDLDNFKTLNETLGPIQGDLLLKQVAERLITCVREGDTVARLGGDEFLVMLEDLSEDELVAAEQAQTAGQKMLTTLNQIYQLGSCTHHSTSSVGVTLFGGERSEAVDEPLKRSELAMHQAKAAGRNTLRFFEAQMQVAVTSHAALEADLREAVRKHQFLLYYQAQVVDEGRMTGAEALVRWQHPQRGLVPPVEFIALAEETGLILPLGHWVLETACTQLALWAMQPEMADLKLAVNVSARQFHQREFVDQVLAVLARTGANPKHLKLELTESLLVDDVEDVIAKMTRLKAEGVGFSLDDFGTGYSSLSYLKRLPLDQLKIDQGFVRNILTDVNDAAIAKMVIALAESMGLAVIAEGVETLAQRDLLARDGCHAYQGYYFSRPVPLTAFEALVRGQPSSGIAGSPGGTAGLIT